MEANIFRFYTQIHKTVGIEYEPEMFTFPKGSSHLHVRAYVPDFRVKFGGHTCYIEAKGFFDDECREKTRLLNKYYPWIKLYFITPQKYQIIKRLYAKRIKVS